MDVSAKCGVRSTRAVRLKSSVAAMSLVITIGWATVAQSEVKVIEAESTYSMGDNDSRTDARRIATQEAKRKALELAGTYVESLSEVKDYQLTRDDVKSYTAGVLETEVVSENSTGTAEHPAVSVRVLCRIDTAVLAEKISQVRDREDMKEQLDASVRESDVLRKERDALVKQLAAEKDKTKAAATRQKLDAVLSREESNDATNAVWVALGPRLTCDREDGPEINREELDRSSAALKRILAVNPQNQRARCLLAAVYRRNGETAAAESELRAAIRHAPSNPAPHMQLAALLRETGKYQEAMKEFHFVERLRPGFLLPVYFEGMTYKDMGRCGKSVQYLNKFLKDRRAVRHPAKKEKALRSIEECGGDRPGRQQRRAKQS